MVHTVNGPDRGRVLEVVIEGGRGDGEDGCGDYRPGSLTLHERPTTPFNRRRSVTGRTQVEEIGHIPNQCQYPCPTGEQDVNLRNNEKSSKLNPSFPDTNVFL